MKLVKFRRDMYPHTAGDERAMPDDVAAERVAAGDGEIVPSVFDAEPAPPAAAEPAPRDAEPEPAPRRRRLYQTRDAT